MQPETGVLTAHNLTGPWSTPDGEVTLAMVAAALERITGEGAVASEVAAAIGIAKPRHYGITRGWSPGCDRRTERCLTLLKRRGLASCEKTRTEAGRVVYIWRRVAPEDVAVAGTCPGGEHG